MNAKVEKTAPKKEKEAESKVERFKRTQGTTPHP